MLSGRSLGHRAPLLWILLPWMAGLVVAYVWRGPLAAGWLLVAAAVAAALAAVAMACRRGRGWGMAGVLAGVALAGAARYEMERHRLADWDALDLPAREARLVVEMVRVFPPSPEQDWISGIGRVEGAETETLRDVAGQSVYFSANRKPGDAVPVRGERFSIRGVLVPLPKHPAVRAAPGATAEEGREGRVERVEREGRVAAKVNPFDGYLADSGVNFRFTRARIVGRVAAAGWCAQRLEQARLLFSENLGRGLERRPEIAGLLRAMVLGQKHELAMDRKELYLQSGTMHLFAISGLHVGVIALAVDCVLGLLTGVLLAGGWRLPAWARVAAGTGLLWLYVQITGASPSAVRAFVMATFLLAAWRLRLPGGSLAALTASAVLVLLIQPLQLFTASFQLSYGIVAALLLLSVPLQESLAERWRLFVWLPQDAWTRRHRAADGARRFVLGLGCMGLAATLVSMVAGVMFFGLFTPLSFLANLVLVPLAGLVLSAGFVSLVCGLAGPGVGVVAAFLNRAAGVVLWFMDSVAGGAARLPGAFFPAEFRAGWVGPAALAGLLVVLAIGYDRKWPAGWRGVAVPAGFVALVLVAGMRFVTLPAS
jgi:competence protein ComEC